MKHKNRLKALGIDHFYCQGILEKNDYGEWMFYDEENKESYYLTDIEAPFECKVNGFWEKVKIKNDYFRTTTNIVSMKTGMKVRFQRTYMYAYELLLEELNDGAFFSLVKGLSKFHYTLYHCIYCHNFLLFQNEQNASGVNFMIFDNKEIVCQVQHFFERQQEITVDRFIFTLSTGEYYSIEFRD